MAIGRKGWRPITVGGDQYFWKAGLDDDWDGSLVVTVVTDVAFRSGCTGQQLGFWLPYPGFPQAGVVTPRIVRLAIELGLDADPPFTGADREPNLALSGEALERVHALYEEVRAANDR